MEARGVSARIAAPSASLLLTYKSRTPTAQSGLVPIFNQGGKRERFMTESGSQVDAGANDDEPVVLVVDDDSSLRSAISSLLRSTGLRVETFGSVTEFLEANLPPAAGCLILDIR